MTSHPFHRAPAMTGLLIGLPLALGSSGDTALAAGRTIAADLAPATSPVGAVAPSATGDPIIYTHSSDSGTVVFINPVTEERVLEFDVGEIATMDQCADDNRDGYPDCYLIGGEHTVINGHDYVVLTVSDIEAKSTLARVSVSAPHVPTWKLDRLDFSQTESNGACTVTCGDVISQPGCGLSFVHDVTVLEENEAEHWVELIVVDTGNSRIAKVHLDYGPSGDATCGQVMWVLDSHDPDWPRQYSIPNGLEMLQEPEGTFMLSSFHTQKSSLAGSGRIQLWGLSSEEPGLVWEYPPDSAGNLPYLNEPHNATLVTDAQGDRYLHYAHSYGDSRIWGAGSGGTLGMAAMHDLLSAPDYLGEWVLPTGYEPLAFPRDFYRLPDGAFFGVDSGCLLVDVPEQRCPSTLYWFQPNTLPSSTLSGKFTTTHRYQNRIELSNGEMMQTLTCGLEVVFEAEILSTDRMGEELRAAQTRSGTPCSDFRY